MRHSGVVWPSDLTFLIQHRRMDSQTVFCLVTFPAGELSTCQGLSLVTYLRAFQSQHCWYFGLDDFVFNASCLYFVLRKFISIRACLLSYFSHVPLCATLWTESPPGSSVHGILQARILEWVTMLPSRGSSWPGDLTCISCISCKWQAESLPLCHMRSPKQ